MSDAFYLGSTKDTYLASPKGVYLASPKHTYLSSPRFYLSSPQSRSQAGKKLWRLEIRTMIRSPDSYAARFLAEVEEMDKGPRELKERAERYAEEFKLRVRAREERLWGKEAQAT